MRYEIVYEDRLLNEHLVTVEGDGFQIGHAGDVVVFDKDWEDVTSPAINHYLFTRVTSVKLVKEEQ